MLTLGHVGKSSTSNKKSKKEEQPKPQKRSRSAKPKYGLKYIKDKKK